MTATATTAQAATAFGVTPATVAHWCRIGAVRATKAAGKWIIDTASLLARKTIAHQIRNAREARARKAAATTTVFRYHHTRPRRMPRRQDGKWSFRCNGVETDQLFTSRTDAEVAAASYIPPKPRKAPAAETPAPAVAPGWSKASRRRTRHGGVHTTMEALTGVASPARPGQCHYCSLPARSCDCF